MVLSLERSLSISAVGNLHSTLQVLFWPTAVSRAVLFARILLFQCWILLGLGRVKPTALPLRAYFCAHKLIRARSHGLIVLQIVASSVLQSQ